MGQQKPGCPVHFLAELALQMPISKKTYDFEEERFLGGSAFPYFSWGVSHIPQAWPVYQRTSPSMARKRLVSA